MLSFCVCRNHFTQFQIALGWRRLRRRLWLRRRRPDTNNGKTNANKQQYNGFFINIHFEHFQYLKHSKTVFSNIFRCKATRTCIWASHSDSQTKHPHSIQQVAYIYKWSIQIGYHKSSYPDLHTLHTVRQTTTKITSTKPCCWSYLQKEKQAAKKTLSSLAQPFGNETKSILFLCTLKYYHGTQNWRFEKFGR